jgi:cyclin B
MLGGRGSRSRGNGDQKRGPFAGGALGDITNLVGGGGKTKPSGVIPEPAPPPPVVPPTAPPPPPTAAPREVRRKVSTKDDAAVEPEWAGKLDPSDLPDASAPQCVAEYVWDIFENLRKDEKKMEADSRLNLEGYMDGQKDLNEKMRSILVDWLVEVHLKFKLNPETLFLTVSLLDRYLKVRHVKRTKLQLVGVTCMLIASKFEEIYAPEVRDFVNITDKAYTKQEILETEVSVLKTLQFKVVTVSPYTFLQRFLSVMKYGKTHKYLAQYILELTLVDYRMLKYQPSYLASAAVLLANKIMRVSEPWPQTLTRHTRHPEADLKACAKEMCALLQGAEKSSLQALRKKFSSEKLGSVAKLLS